jgi:anti-sigma factor RsiW
MVTHGHSTDDELILLFYGELPPGRADRVEEHVTACPSCRAAWADLQETLALVDHAPAPEPDDGFERVMWARVRDALPERRRWSIAQIVPVTAMAAVAANELLASGRLYRLTARETGNGRLVEMLDDLEPVLVEVARSPERVARRDWESLRTRIGEQDLLFKVRAASYEMRAPR